MLGDTYLFIDGGYLREVYKAVFNPLFGDMYKIDFKLLMDSFAARRAYLYDCLDDVIREGETDDDFARRVKQQQDHFDAIDRTDGLHVRYGVLSGGKPKRRRQKEVDVLLAVDMLTHSFSKNMDEAVLLAGDLDFRPVVESVVRLGTRVSVAFERKTVASELLKEADVEREISITDLCNWIAFENPETERPLHFPAISLNYLNRAEPLWFRSIMYPLETIRRGVIGPGRLALIFGQLMNPRRTEWCASVQTRKGYVVYIFYDDAKLLAYLETLFFGKIEWTKVDG
jgi:uncharacterized LabA/DUF88 family protein